MKNASILLGTLLCVATLPALSQEEDGEEAHGVPVCMPQPRVAVGDNSPIISQMSSDIREQVAAYLAGPLVEPRGVDARLPVQVKAEAAAQKCHYILNITFTHKPNSKIGRRTAETAMTVGSVVGSFSSGGSTALGAASTLGGLFRSSGGGGGSDAGAGFYPVGKNDQVEIKYSLELVDSPAVVKSATHGGKATKDNEPLVDTLVEKMAGEIVEAVAQ